MTINDAIFGTIIQKTGIIPCLARPVVIIDWNREFLSRVTDKYTCIVVDGYRDKYTVVFHVRRNDYGEITSFRAIEGVIHHE